jgi:hypothetical protein
LTLQKATIPWSPALPAKYKLFALPELSIRNNLFAEITPIFKGGIDQIEGE